MKIINIMINNKSGGLIYTFKQDMEFNYLMVISSSLNTIYTHSQEIEIFKNDFRNPPLYIYTTKKKIGVYVTLTGYCFIIVFENNLKINLNDEFCEVVFKEVYRIFSNYALKNPFYINEMPICCDKFQFYLNKYLTQNKYVDVGPC